MFRSRYEFFVFCVVFDSFWILKEEYSHLFLRSGKREREAICSSLDLDLAVSVKPS